jgi:hypothetical protein
MNNSTYFKNVSIYYNIFKSLGTTNAGGDYQTWGIYFNIDNRPALTGENIFIYNNTFQASTSTGYHSMDGIVMPRPGTFSNIKIKNNIILNFSHAAILGNGNYALDNLQIMNNIMYGNGNINDPLAANGFSPTNYTYSGTIKSDPLFVSTSDFHLQSGSPARDAGLNVGLTTDYTGHSVPQNTLFDIGAYEYGNWVLRSGGKIIRSGGKIVTVWQ